MVDSLTDLWDNIKCTIIQIIGVPEEEEKKKGYEKIFKEIIVENFPNMEKEIVNQVQEAQRVPYRRNPRRNTPRHILIKLTKESESEVAQPCLTLCNPTDCSLPGSSIHGIFQARVLEWVAIAFSEK